jgi:hypothetical protein
MRFAYFLSFEDMVNRLSSGLIRSILIDIIEYGVRRNGVVFVTTLIVTLLALLAIFH